MLAAISPLGWPLPDGTLLLAGWRLLRSCLST